METQKFIDAYQAELNKARLLFLLTDERIAKMVEEEKLDLDFVVLDEPDKLSLREFYVWYNAKIEEKFIITAELLLISYAIETLSEEEAMGILSSYSELFTEEGLAKAEDTVEYYTYQANADLDFFNKLNDFLKWVTEEAMKEGVGWHMTEKQVLDSKLAKDIFGIMYSAWTMQKEMRRVTATISRL